MKVLVTSVIFGSLQPHGRSPPGSSVRGILQARLLVKVAQSCPALCDPMDYTVHGILQARILVWVAFHFSRGIFPTQGSNPGLLHCRWILYQLSHYRGQLASGNLLYDAWSSNLVLCDNLEEWDKVGGRFKREEIYVYLWLTYVDV